MQANQGGKARHIASRALFGVAAASVVGEAVSLVRGSAKYFAGAAVAVAVAGEAVAYVRDKTQKPTPDQVVSTTRHNAQATLASATYGTDIVLNPDQRPVVPGPHDTYPYHAVKRIFDVAFSSAVVALGAIPTAFVCAAIAADDPGSPIYLQRRVGRYGVPIHIVKLRTMVSDADQVEKHLTDEQLDQWFTEHKVDDDPRVTEVGAFLRKTSLDEVPQFLNVLIGQMSVIGPRPVEPDELVAYDDSVAEFLSITPGITGWWQVKARNDAAYEDGSRQRLELEYARDRSLKRDFEVFFRTFSAMFGPHQTGY